MGYVFNLGLVVNNGDMVVMISCESEKSISRAKVGSIATAYLNNALRDGVHINEAVSAVISGLKTECNLDARVTTSDITYVVNKSKGGHKYERQYI